MMEPSIAGRAGERGTRCRRLRVVFIAADGVPLTELAAFETYFGQGVPGRPYDASLALLSAIDGEEVVTDTGLRLQVNGIHNCPEVVDIVAMGNLERAAEASDAAIAFLVRAADRGAVVLGLGSGARVLGAAGLVDDLTVTTYRRDTPPLTSLVRRSSVDATRTLSSGHNVFTAGGHAGTLDVCRYLVAELVGVSAAEWLTDAVACAPYRFPNFGQAPSRLVGAATEERIAEVVAWLMQDLSRAVAIEDMARRVHMSRRTFARRFKDVWGVSPYAWLTQQRLEQARKLLEDEPELSLEEVAGRSGMSGSTGMTSHFLSHVGMTPIEYREVQRLRRESAGFSEVALAPPYEAVTINAARR